MQIQHVENESQKGEFYYEVDGKKLAMMTYSKAGKDKIIIDHTEVDSSLQGKGIGYELVAEAVDFARKNNIKIMPLCPFAASVFRKTSDYNNVKF